MQRRLTFIFRLKERRAFNREIFRGMAGRVLKTAFFQRLDPRTEPERQQLAAEHLRLHRNVSEAFFAFVQIA